VGEAQCPNLHTTCGESEQQMKFRVTFKGPDGIFDCIQDAAKEEARRVVALTGDLLSADELAEKVRDNIKEKVGQFIDCDCVHIEFDTDEKTARVLTSRDQ
jgi:hypothetical protein